MNDNKDAIRVSSITREDMHLKKIIDTAPSTALYTYDEVSGQWTKDNVEGTLTIYERVAPPHSMMKIFNKLSKVDFIEPLYSNCEIQVKPPYLLFKNTKGNIYGIWFNDQKDVDRMASAIKEQIESEPLPQKALFNDPAIAVARSAAGDIMTMLSLAHGEFESKRHEPSRMVTSVTTANAELVKPSPLRVNDANSNNVVAEFLAKVGGAANPPTGGRTLHSPSSGVPLSTSGAPSSATNPMLQKLFQGAAAIGGQASVGSATGTSAPIAIPGSSAHTSSAHSGSMTGSTAMSLQELEGKLKEHLHVGSARNEEGHMHLKMNPAAGVQKSAENSSSLLSPQVFTSSHAKDLECQSKELLMHPYSNLNTTNIGLDSKTFNGDEPGFEDPAMQGNVTPLTQDQLVQAFTFLLKKEDFVRQLHEAYVQALHRSYRGGI